MGHSKKRLKSEKEEYLYLKAVRRQLKKQSKKSKQSKKRHYKNQGKGLFKFLSKSTTHHRRPVSCAGSNSQENKCSEPLLRHAAWHILWENMEPENILQLIFEKTPEEIIEDNPIRKLAFEIIFGYWPTTVKQRIEIALKYWMPKDEKFKKFLSEFLKKNEKGC